MTYAIESESQAFDQTEEKWFSERPQPRPSQRPTRPVPSMPAPSIDDSIADGWFFDV